MPGDLAGHRFTGPGGPVQCESILVMVWPPGKYARRPGARSELHKELDFRRSSSLSRTCSLSEEPVPS